MQVMLMRLMSKGEYVIVPKGTKFTGSGKLGLISFKGVYPIGIYKLYIFNQTSLVSKIKSNQNK